MHQSLQYLKVLNCGHLDVLFRPWHNMHLSATKLSHQRAGGYRIGDALLLCLFVCRYKIAQAEGLRCLRPDELVSRNTGIRGESVFALQYCLTDLIPL